jgi:RimJ/RimL family protein N-acetyltransferase
MPSYKQHCEFWDSKPYKFVKIIDGAPGFMGYVYITHRYEVGIHIKREFQKKGIGTSILKKLIRDFDSLLINIAPDNEVALKLAKKMGFELIQETYHISHGKI